MNRWVKVLCARVVSWLRSPTVGISVTLPTGYKKPKQEIPVARWKHFTDEEVKGLLPEFVDKLDEAREIAGIPFRITSGKRGSGDNATVGGVQDSAHLRGRAVDLRSRSSHTHSRIIDSAKDVGITRRGYYTDQWGGQTHVHIDDDPTLPQHVIWYGVSK